MVVKVWYHGVAKVNSFPVEMFQECIMAFGISINDGTGVPLNHPCFSGLSLINHPFWGTHHFRKPPFESRKATTVTMVTLDSEVCARPKDIANYTIMELSASVLIGISSNRS